MRSRGFTQLELLVALIVFAALAALVYGTVRIGSRSWQAGTGRRRGRGYISVRSMAGWTC